MMYLIKYAIPEFHIESCINTKTNIQKYVLFMYQVYKIKLLPLVSLLTFPSHLNIHKHSKHLENQSHY